MNEFRHLPVGSFFDTTAGIFYKCSKTERRELSGEVSVTEGDFPVRALLPVKPGIVKMLDEYVHVPLVGAMQRVEPSGQVNFNTVSIGSWCWYSGRAVIKVALDRIAYDRENEFLGSHAKVYPLEPQLLPWRECEGRVFVRNDAYYFGNKHVSGGMFSYHDDHKLVTPVQFVTHSYTVLPQGKYVTLRLRVPFRELKAGGIFFFEGMRCRKTGIHEAVNADLQLVQGLDIVEVEL